MPAIVTDDNFADATATGVVLVDFYADWCGPCQQMLPLMDELEQEYEGKATIVKVNTDESSATAQKFGVMSIPTFKILKDGEEVGSVTGGVPKEKLVEALEAALS